LSSWDEVIAQPFSAPSYHEDNCTFPWTQIILDVSASEIGTQFDRYFIPTK
jgi:hypothetical protein